MTKKYIRWKPFRDEIYRAASCRQWLHKVIPCVLTIFFPFYLGYIYGGKIARDNDVYRPTETNMSHEMLLPHNRNQYMFTETSGKVCLTLRQLCAIESAARSNPHKDIVLFISLSPVLTYKYDVPVPEDEYRDCVSTRKILQLNNVYMVMDVLDNFLRGTVLYDWIRKGVLHSSYYPMFHAGDVLKAGLLKRFGGIFLDLDCITIKPLNIFNNAIGMHSQSRLDFGVLAFQHNHKFLDILIQTIKDNFSPGNYLSAGPDTVTKAVKEFCNITIFEAKTYSCQHHWDISLMAPSDFYLISFDERKAFFNSEKTSENLLRLEYSLISHVFDSDDGLHKAVNGTLYYHLAEKYCPVV